MNRRNFVYLGLSSLGTTDLVGLLRRQSSLKSHAHAKGLIYGAAARASELSRDREFAQRFIEECAILTPENDLKWHWIHPSRDRFNFKIGDWLIKFAQTNGLQMRGHNLIWHAYTPAWLRETLNQKNAESVLINHIETVVARYKGLIHSWDVVNEAIEIADENKHGLRNSPWLDWLGEDYIDLSFRVAAQADPAALLVYNDYDLEYDTPQQEARRNAVLKLLERLKAKGTPIHALGLQAHLSVSTTYLKAAKLRQFLADVASLGLKIIVTEMDVSDRGLPYFYRRRDRLVADVYEMFLSMVLDEPSVIAVITWGLSDRYTWLSKHKPRLDGTYVRPLPLDASLKNKLAWHSIVKAFENATRR